MKPLLPLLRCFSFLTIYVLVVVNGSGEENGKSANSISTPKNMTQTWRIPTAQDLASSYSLAAFHNFMTKFSKKYSSIAEYRTRYNIFRKNMRKILISRGIIQKMPQLDLANIADMTKAEIKQALETTKQSSVQALESTKQSSVHRNLTKIHKLEVGFCPGSPRPFSIDLATVKPFPVIIATGQSVTINFKVTLNTVIPKGSTVSLKIKKHESWLPNIPIPCLDIEGQHIGSCTYAADFLLEHAAPVLCPTFVPAGQECKLPLRPGVYGGARPLVVGPINEVPQVIADLLANGEYDAKAYLRTAKGNLFACVFVKVRLTHR